MTVVSIQSRTMKETMMTMMMMSTHILCLQVPQPLNLSLDQTRLGTHLLRSMQVQGVLKKMTIRVLYQIQVFEMKLYYPT